MPTVELRFSPVPFHVRTARLVAAAVGRRSGLREDLLDEVKLAVGEACSRAVSVHQEHGRDALVEVLLSDDDAAFTVAVTDRGPHGADLPDGAGGTSPAEAASAAREVDLDTAETRAPAEDPEGPSGSPLPPVVGLAVIAGLVDDVTVGPLPGDEGTVVTMRWPLDAAPLDAGTDVDL